MPPQGKSSKDADFTRSQEHHHLHHIVESIQRYNKCNRRSRRLMLIHVDEREEFAISGAFGTPTMVSCALSSGLLSLLTDASSGTKILDEKESRYMPFVPAPRMTEFVDAPLEYLQSSLVDLLSCLRWPNLEYFSYITPLGWPESTPFVPLREGGFDRSTLLLVLKSLYAAHFSRVIDLHLCVHATGSCDDVYHTGRCEHFSRDVQELFGNETQAANTPIIKFTDHQMNVGGKGVGFELKKREKSGEKSAPKPGTGRKRKQPQDESAEAKLLREVSSLRRRNAYSLYVAENYGSVSGTFGERQKKLAELWRTADQKGYRKSYRRPNREWSARAIEPIELNLKRHKVGYNIFCLNVRPTCPNTVKRSLDWGRREHTFKLSYVLHPAREQLLVLYSVR